MSEKIMGKISHTHSNLAFFAARCKACKNLARLENLTSLHLANLQVSKVLQAGIVSYRYRAILQGRNVCIMLARQVYIKDLQALQKKTKQWYVVQSVQGVMHTGDFRYVGEE